MPRTGLCRNQRQRNHRSCSRHVIRLPCIIRVGQDEQGETVFIGRHSRCPLQVTAKPYLNELYYNDGAPAAVEGAEYDLSRIPLLARDQHGNPVEFRPDISGRWQTPIRPMPRLKTENCLLRLGQVSPRCLYADVILEALLCSAGKTAKNVVVKVKQQPTLKTIRADMKDGFVLRLDENAVLADQFTLRCDQYGREMTGGSFEWVTSKPDVVLTKRTLKALERRFTEIYARSGDIESNHITLTVNASETADCNHRRRNSVVRSKTLRWTCLQLR